MINFLLFCYIDSGAGGLVNPNKTYAAVQQENTVGHELYRQTHRDFYVGEPLHRAYSSPNFSSKSRFGIPTPHDNTGNVVKSLLKAVF